MNDGYLLDDLIWIVYIGVYVFISELDKLSIEIIP